jgi:hypothetical protein
VNPALSALLLLIPVLAMAMLLLQPGVAEWLKPTDAAPLAIDGLYAKDDRIFADRFRKLAAGWWQDPDPLGHGQVDLGPGTLLARPVLVAALATGAGVDLEEEVWARENLRLGVGSLARALVSDRGIHLARDCNVQRWIHGDTEVTLDQHCHVSARITAGERILLAAGCRSQLVSAPTIEWRSPRRPMNMEIPSHARRWLRRRRIPETGSNWQIPRQETPGGTVFVNGDLILDAEADIDFPLVVRGNLYIRRGALIAGDLKAHGNLVVEGSTVVGNLCCSGNLLVGEGSWVQGCLRGDALVWLGDEVVVGRPERPEAVVGNRIVLAGTGTVHGRLRALAGWVEVES